MISRRLAALLVAALLAFHASHAFDVRAGEVAKADLDILGTSLEVDRNPVITAVDVASYVQTIFGGKTNAEAPPAGSLSVLGDLTGPGIDRPITLSTKPGHRFALPALHEKGEYALQNIRLVGGTGEFLQNAVPSFAIIQVSDVLQTSVRVRQLTPEELRARGIVVDARNFEVYEYEFIFGVAGQQVVVPYPVLVDRRTHEVTPVAKENPYALPPLSTKTPPRFTPPEVLPFEFAEPGDGELPPPSTSAGETRTARPSIPAALVVPTGFGVLHQFFGVMLQVDNAAPAGSTIRLDSITATIDAPTALRVAKVLPAVALGQPVPVRDASGSTFLVAGAQGKAEWTLEALKSGTHSVTIIVNATYQKPGEPDIPLRGKVSTSLVVSDPRFQINFSHPDTVRKDEPYTAYAFVTNLSPQRQHVVIDSGHIPLCSSGAAVENICRTEGSPVIELDLGPGEMKPVPYKMTSKVTGRVFAAAGTANDEAIGVSVRLTMGVSTSGIPLSPATLVLPHYAQWVPNGVVDGTLQLLGLGYSLAVAPLTQHTATMPRVIKSDVFRRAQDIARAGQRIFIARAERDTSDPATNIHAIEQLALDLLGNVERVDQLAVAPELSEWDELRRAEVAGRTAAAAMARQLETDGLAGGKTPKQFADEFIANTSHRAPFLFAYAHGGAKVSVTGKTSGGVASGAAEGTTWTRTLPFAEITRFGTDGEMALVGRWKEDLRISVLPSSSTFTLHLMWPDTADGTFLRAEISVSGATPGSAVTLDLARGARTLTVSGASAAPIVDNVTPTPLRVIGAAQDLHLDDGGHVVSLLFNRPIGAVDQPTLRDRFALTTKVAKASYEVTRRNDGTTLQVPGATLQEDGRILHVSFDKTLSRNAQYAIGVDALNGFSASGIVPRVDNNRPGGILTGKVLRGDNTSVANAVVELLSNDVRQLDISGADGRFLYEFVPRDIDSNISGAYILSTAAEGKSAKVEGSVRLPGEVHTVNLQFLGRGSAQGQVRYSDGVALPNVEVTIGSTLFDQFRRGTTDANGNYTITDLPVGPLTFSVVDAQGRPTFAANQIRTPGEVVTQDLVIQRRDEPGLGTVRVVVRRSDTNAAVPNARVGVYTQGYGLQDGYTDANGFFEFARVPAGLVSILASEFSITRESVGIELDLRADQTLETSVVLRVPKPTDAAYASLEGTVKRDNPSAPDPANDQFAPGAILSITGLPAVTVNADGTYVYPEVPLSFSGRRITVFDPATGRRGQFSLPTLVSGTNHFPIRLSTATPEGLATMRVRLTGARGEAVSGYRVISPGYPPIAFTDKGNGVYEVKDVRVPVTWNVAAVPSNREGPYGEQFVEGSVRVDFHGQIGVADLRLPGHGTIVARLEGSNGSQILGPAAVTYRVWDEAEQSVGVRTIELAQDATSGLVTFTKVPTRQDVSVETVRNPAGYDREIVRLTYDGEARNVTLTMQSLGDVTGRVFAHDLQTPISGATVRLTGGPADYGAKLTAPDGSFRFPAVAANVSFRIVADYTQDGVYRTGYVHGATPQGGGPVQNLVIVMREQSTVEGQVVDLSDQPVPLARYWARELAWPYRDFGTPQEPLTADINGRFLLTNVFTGAFRITAVAPDNQEVRGDYQGTLAGEGDVSQRNVRVRIGGGGTGNVSVRVVDPDRAFVSVPNAEITLWRGPQRFDVTTTDDNGAAYFSDVPVGSYSVRAYSKALGRAGSAPAFTVEIDETEAVRISLELRGEVSGKLTDPESEPAGAAVKGMPVTLESAQVQTRASTDGVGAFVFLGVPEGPFRLTAFDLDSGRIAVGPAGLYIDALIKEQRNIHLELERTGTLTVKTYLPNDTGGPGELAPLADVTVQQKAGHEPIYLRGLQGNPVSFPKMLTRYGYELVVKEVGGEGRTVRTSGSFSSLAKEHVVVFPTSGSVEVTVVDGANAPVADALVRINDRVLYTPASGVVTFSGLPFGWITVQASKGNVAASAGAQLATRAEPLRFRLNLGNTIAIAGKVEAEQGIAQPSADTRVVLEVTSSLLTSTMRLETRTDAGGNYSFRGIPVGNTTLTLIFLGPDDITVGARRVVNVPNGTTGTMTMATVRLDATPPRVLSITPAANESSVAPNTNVTVVFSEPIAGSYLSTSWFQLIATDDSTRVNATIQPSINPDGTYTVKLIPPSPPAGQTYPLKSNMLYRFLIPQGIQDTTGNAMSAPVGSSFTTVNYTEPSIVSITPGEDLPLPSNATIRVKFNKPIDLASFEPGGNGTLTLEKLDGPRGVTVKELTIARRLETDDPSTLVVTPQGAALEPSSFYRLIVAGARDTQSPPNVQKDARIFYWSSFDTVRPVVTIASPPASQALVARVLYTATPRITDHGTTSESKDIAYVDWLDGEGKVVARVKTAPFAYSFQAPATTTGTTYTLQASATDLSGQVSEMATATWNVTPNEAPRNIVVTNTPASAYPTKAVQSRVTFEDEGVFVSVALELTGTATDGSAIRTFLGSTNVTRASTAEPFLPAVFTYALPANLKDGSATITASVKDSVDLTGTGSATLTVLADTIAPKLVSLTPAPETRFAHRQNITITFAVKDDETAIARATLTIDGTGVTPAMTTANGVTTFTYSYATPARNADTRVRINATAYDLRDNPIAATTDIIYERRDDASVPNAAWITPLDGAALPHGQSGWKTTLRVRATDDTGITAVRFESSAISGGALTVTTPKSGTSDIFEVQTELAMPADKSPFTIKAIVSDGAPDHDVELPITIDPVAVDVVVDGPIGIIESLLPQYEDKSVFVKGTAAIVYLPVPLRVRNLIVADGAVLSNTEETKFDLTVTDRLFVDADSRVDLNRRGFLGAWRNREGNSVTNQVPTGRTLSGAGASGGASASHAGIGGLSATGTTNATYGSITAPSDFGGGGSGGATSAQPGENGGGAVRIRGGEGLARLVVAGDITADGGSCASTIGCGAGGSIWLTARALITGPETRITANGGDESSAANMDLGGGGGRIAVSISDRLDIAANRLQARGGRNGGTSAPEGAEYVDGGAGTIHLKRPGATHGELIVSAFDERKPSSTHQTRGTPLGGTLQFDAITIGPRALARFDSTHGGTMTVEPTALVVGTTDLPALTLGTLTPAANSTVPQDTSITALFDAASRSGIGDVRAILTMADGIALSRQFPASIDDGSVTVAIPHDAATGATTLKLRATDRAGRVVETDSVAYTIAANTAAAIDEFTVTPSAEMYPGGTINVSAKASDDVSVADLTLASTIGSVTTDPFARPTPKTMTCAFRVAIPPAATGEVTLTLRATDTYRDRAATTATHKVTLKADTIDPALTVALPQANQQYEEGTGNTITVEATATDAEVAVKDVKVTFDGVTTLLTATGNVYRGTVPVPNVDGTEPVAMTLVVVATDHAGNDAQVAVPVTIKPLVRPDAPDMAWVCTSPGALYPRGYEVPIRFTAVPKSADNGVVEATVSIDGQPAMNATLVGTNLYEVKFTIPADAASERVFKVRAATRSVSNADASLLTSFTVVDGTPLTSPSTLEATDLRYENTSVVVGSGGVLTIIGPHRFTNLVVLSGGEIDQKHTDFAKGDRVEAGRIYVACDGTIDVDGLGYTANSTYPGAGWPDDRSGGGHMGQGAADHRQGGGTYDSVYEPRAPGGGGHIRTATPTGTAGAGGGVVRLHATASMAIDGNVFARGKLSSNGGGAGGSIWLTTAGTLAGNGRIEANGASASSGDGGGGAIALEYATLSGNIVKNARARSGSVSGDTLPAAAGTIYTRRGNATGDLLVDNATTGTFSATELPSFGRHVATSVAGANVTLDSNAFVSPSLIGHRIRVTAPNGTARGTYRLASVTKHATTRILTNHATIQTQDGLAYDGYLLYSTAGLGGEKRTLAAVRKNGAQWQYDNDSAFLNFTPGAGDFLFASFKKASSAITDVTIFRCNGACGSVEGLPVAEMVSGELLANMTMLATVDGLRTDDVHEFALRADGHRRGIVFSGGAATIALESLDGGAVNIQPGDALRGVYVFDNLTATGARIRTDDLLETANAPLLTASTIERANDAPPLIDASKITLVHGAEGATIVGAIGAITDLDGAIEVTARNTARSVPSAFINPSNGVSVGNAGGLSLYHVPNGRTDAAAVALAPIVGSGHVQWTLAQNDVEIQVSLAPADTVVFYDEPGHQSFRFLTNGTYQIWANAANTGKTGTYRAMQPFRIEKSGGTVRWFANGVKVHEITGAPSSLLLQFPLPNMPRGEIASIEYVVDGRPQPTFRAKVNADGSFRLPVLGAAGDAIVLRARDNHRASLASNEIAAGAFPADLGVASIAFAPPEVTGGRTAVGTVTLLAPAPSDGAIVELVSADTARVTVPATITVAAGQTTATFNAVTTSATEPVEVAITARYGGIGTTANLRIVRDNIAPTVTIDAPAENSQHVEGSKFTVSVTATDADSGLSAVRALIDGVTTNLTKGTGNTWSGQVAAPFITGSANVSKTLTVTAVDNNNNSAPATRTIVITPVTSSAPPTLTWNSCGRYATYPVGHAAKIRVTAVAPASGNPIRAVEAYIGAEGPVNVPLLSGNDYELTWTVPTVAATTEYPIRVVASTAGDVSVELPGHITAVVPDKTFNADATIAANDTTWDNKVVVVTAGTLTISGAHPFAHLVILGGSVTHPALDASGNGAFELRVTGNVFVACSTSIDVNGRGYNTGSSYPGETLGASDAGGSHMGRGALRDTQPPASTFGSVTHPREAGGSAANASRGGGVVPIKAASVAIDGTIRANGNSGTHAGAGGSVLIETGRITGIGSIETNGGSAARQNGGGGAIAIHYTDAVSMLPSLRSTMGGIVCCGGEYRAGGPGTIFLKGPAATHGELRIDSVDTARQATVLPSLGSGIAAGGTSGATLVTDRATDVPAYFVQHWVEIANKGTWRIASVSGKSITLAPNGNETISLAPGDAWQGVYRFDRVIVQNNAKLLSADPIRTADVQLAGRTSDESVDVLMPLDATTITTSGRVSAVALSGTTLNIGGTLFPRSALFAITAANVNVTGTIDATGSGFASGTTYPGESLGAAGNGGSHMGQGALSTAPLPSTFGSVYRPLEGGGSGLSGTGPGGGVVHVKTQNLTVSGSIRANGSSANATHAGAGGSVLIETARVSGSGTIEANGGGSSRQIGGGGAVAVYYTDSTSTLPTLRALTGEGFCCSGLARTGGAGTVYVHGPGATYGELRINDANRPGELTVLPSLGSGVAAAGTNGATLVIDRATDVPAYFGRHWIEIADKGTWRVASISGKSITLAPNGSETISLAPGDAWQGVYRFDRVVATNSPRISSPDPIRAADWSLTGPGSGAQMVFVEPLDAPSMTINGRVVATAVKATNLTVAGTLLASSSLLTVDAQNLTVSGSIDATSRGYANGTTYPGESIGGAGNGGSHIGQGALNELPLPSTFGSVYRPREGGGSANGAGPGGGVIRIRAQNLVVNGAIYARGTSENATHGGAGGSIWVTTAKISGTGSLDAMGGSSSRQIGGGGAIAVEYTDPASVMPALNVPGGEGFCCSGLARASAPGSAYVKGPSMTYGELWVDGHHRVAQLTVLPSLGSGSAASGTAGATLVLDRATNVPAYFEGHWVEIASKGTWRIASISGKSVTLAPNGTETINLAPGDAWQGIYRFDKLVLRRGAKLGSHDRIDAGSNDSPSSLIPHNGDTPRFEPALISLSSGPAGDAVSGTAGAVIDSNAPVRVTATNARTSLTYSANANADGSFRVTVIGEPGDTFTIVATDGHALPRTSSSFAVPGAIADTNGVSSISVAPSPVTAGNSVVATVRLRFAAARATSVALSSDSAAITIPASITIAAGQTTAQFTIATSSDTTANITATYNGSVTAQLRVIGGTSDLESLTIAPATVEGGASATGTVTLGTFPANDIAVTLTSSDTTRATVPPQVTVQGGQTSANFTITTTRVAAPSSVQITASYGATHAATLDLTACASLGSVAQPADTTLTTTWVDDALPANATASGTGASFDSTQSANGTSAIHFTAAAGARNYGFSGASALPLTPNDKLVFYVLANPCNPPRQILLTWSGSTTLRTSHGESLVGATTATHNLGAIPGGGAWTRVEVLARALGITSTASLTGLSIDVHGGEAWIDRIGTSACTNPIAAAPPADANEQLWFDDDVPSGASTTNWSWSTAQRAGGTRAFTHPPTTTAHEQSFSGAATPINTQPGDVLFTWVYLDPCNPPRQVVLTYAVGATRYRGYWGEDLTYPNTVNTSNVRIGALPEAGKWVRLELPVSLLGLDSASITGYGFGLYDGNAWGDRVGKIGRVNLSRGRAASQSSTLANYDASRAVDDNLSGASGVIYAHTGSQSQPWWQVDLGGVQSIEDIQLWNVTDGNEGALNNFVVFVSDVPFTGTTVAASVAQPGVSAYLVPKTAARSNTFRVARSGRYVRVQLQGSNYLRLAELQVWAPVSLQTVNLAGGRAATQSSAYDADGKAEHAVNADLTNAYRGVFSHTHTNNDANAWWELDLGSVQPISAVEIYNRVDASQERLANYYVLISDAPFTSKTLSTSLAQAGVWQLFIGGSWRTTSVLPVHRTGRYIRIQLNRTDYLTLSEVRVLSQQPTLKPLSRPSENQ